RFPPPHPARRRGCQDAILDPPAHASPCLRVQARQRWPRHTGSAALPRPPEHPAYGPVHRNGARPLQEFLALTGGGKLGTASPSISFALCAWAAIDALMCSIMASSCSSVSSLSGFLCSTLCWRGSTIAITLRYIAGFSSRTRAMALSPYFSKSLSSLFIEARLRCAAP